jgi:hypothetical protein
MAARQHRSALVTSEDMVFQRRTWLVERVGWVVMALILIGALLGLFGGGGVVASAETSTEDGSLSVRYERFCRVDAPSRLRVAVRPPDEASVLRLWLGSEYTEAVHISRVFPEPERVEASADRYVFEFALAEPADAVAILFEIEPKEAWGLDGRLGVDGGADLRFDQFVYP